MALRGPHPRGTRRAPGPTLHQIGVVLLLVFVTVCLWMLPHTHRTVGRRLGAESGSTAAAGDAAKGAPVTAVRVDPAHAAGAAQARAGSQPEAAAATAGAAAAAATAGAAAAAAVAPAASPPPHQKALPSPAPAGSLVAAATPPAAEATGLPLPATPDASPPLPGVASSPGAPPAAAATPQPTPALAAPAVPPPGTAAPGVLEVVGGVFITGGTSAALIGAFRDAARWYNGNRTGSHVSLRFFVGSEGHPLQSKPGGDDIVAGAFAENMDGGKTFEWWSHTARAYPAADWVFKIDTDSAVNWGKLLPMLGRPSGPVLVGHRNSYDSCGRYAHCPPENCTDMEGHCWVYMSGGLYGMSGNLTRTVASCSYAQTNRYGNEDAVSGRAVKNCAVGRVNVTHINNGIAWCHSKINTQDHLRHGYFPKGCGD